MAANAAWSIGDRAAVLQRELTHAGRAMRISPGLDSAHAIEVAGLVTGSLGRLGFRRLGFRILQRILRGTLRCILGVL